MGNIIDKYLCHKMPEVTELNCDKNNADSTEMVTDTESTASFGNYMSSREISKHPKLVRRFHSFKRIKL